MADDGRKQFGHGAGANVCDWLPIDTRVGRGRGAVLMFRHATDRRRLRVLRDDDYWPGGSEVDLPGHGRLRAYELLDDPALSSMREILAQYSTYEVLRYRPGKRLTVAADDPDCGSVIIKCICAGVRSVVARLEAAAGGREALSFDVSAPTGANLSETVFVQQRLDGQAPCFERVADAARLARDMARALTSLHRSSIEFDTVFRPSDQQRRSHRYANAMKSRFPALADAVDSLVATLERLQRELERTSAPLVPVHGSLHSHQWLVNGDRLALVDFDRAAMGHAELDVATFLTEWDYEPGALGWAVGRAFAGVFSGCDDDRLAFYRAHKHLAKAFKASKGVHAERAAGKCARNLEKARRLVA